MKPQLAFLAFGIGAVVFCARAESQTALEIKSPAELRRYQRLKNQPKQRAQEIRATKIWSRFESKTLRREALALSPDGRKYLRVTGYLPKIYYRASIHDARSGALLLQLPPPLNECGGAWEPQWSPDGKLVSFGEVEMGNALFFDARTGKKLWQGQRRYLYSPSGNTLVMIDYDLKIKREILLERERKTGRVLRRLPLIPTTYGLTLEFFAANGDAIYMRGSGGESRHWKIDLR